MAETPFLSIEGISKQLNGQQALHPFSLSLAQHHRLAIVGSTGSGKSTLLKIVGGLLQTDSGRVFFENRRLLGPEEQLLPGNKGIAYLSQHFELRNNYRVEEILSFVNRLTTDATQHIFDICRINHLLKRKTDQLSGGEKQRIATAKLLLEHPSLLLLDEPFTNLDYAAKLLMKQVLDDIGQQLGITCVLVSHDPADTLAWADSILVMQHGRMVQIGSPQQVYYQPADSYIAGLLGDFQMLTPLQQEALHIQQVSNQQPMVRSTYFQVAASGQSNGVPALVKATAFAGSHYEVTVQLADAPLRVRSVLPITTKQVWITLNEVPIQFW